MKKTAQLSLLESSLKELGYTVRYEKGNFLGGECRLRNDRVVVVNRFLPLEGKLYTLANVIAGMNPPGMAPELARIVDTLVGSTLFSRNGR